MRIDHLAVASSDLEAGVAWVEVSLGVPLQPGGQHAHYGTHNRLLSLGPDIYLEVIAPDPASPPPGRPRWFGLDQAGAPRLGNWIVQCDDLESRVAQAGPIVPLTRADLAWQITVPVDGSLSEGGAYPSLIRWTAGTHPAGRLTDRGVRLSRLEVFHPEPDRIAALLAGLHDPRVHFLAGDVGLRAAFETPEGLRWLG